MTGIMLVVLAVGMGSIVVAKVRKGVHILSVYPDELRGWGK